MKPKASTGPDMLLELAGFVGRDGPYPLIDAQGRHALIDAPRIERSAPEPGFPWGIIVTLILVVMLGMLGFAYL